jgi:hypothetical protein
VPADAEDVHPQLTAGLLDLDGLAQGTRDRLLSGPEPGGRGCRPPGTQLHRGDVALVGRIRERAYPCGPSQGRSGDLEDRP